MTNNDILRQIRYAFDYNDAQMIELFSMANLEVTRSQVSNWLKKDSNPLYQEMTDNQLAYFLNGLINSKRGKRAGDEMVPEKQLNNNIIFRKLKIALNMRDQDIIETLSLVDLRIGRPELNAFFRNPKHRQYRECKDQFLRNYLHGIIKKYRVDKLEK
jgi:uncharacterized protein YehS (DUF1456 family)